MEKKGKPHFPVSEFPRVGEYVRTATEQKGVVVSAALEKGVLITYVRLDGGDRVKPFIPFALSLEIDPSEFE